MNQPRPKVGAPEIAKKLVDFYRQSGVRELVEDQVARIAANLVSRDAYRIVGVEPGDPPALIRGVFRAKVKVWHPDKGTGDPEQFMLLRSAYEVVLNAEGISDAGA